jgi:hypothetical protein
MSDEVFLCSLLISFQGGAEDCLEVGRRRRRRVHERSRHSAGYLAKGMTWGGEDGEET